MFMLSMETGNAAFDPPAEEIARILRGVGERLVSGYAEGALYDSNGNRGGFTLITYRASPKGCCFSSSQDRFRKRASPKG